MGGGSETITDIQFVKLLKPGEAEKKAKKYIKRNSMGQPTVYMEEYNAYRKIYRNTLRPSYLEKIGYAAKNSATGYVLDTGLLSSYLIGVYGVSSLTVIDAKDKYLTTQDKIDYGKQYISGYNLDTGYLFAYGYKYTLLYGYLIDSTTVGYAFKMWYEDAVKKYLAENYTYDEAANTVTIAGVVYTVGPIEDNAVDSYYSVTLTSGTTTLTVNPPVVTTDVQYNNELYDDLLLFVRFSSADLGIAFRYYLAPADSVPVYSTQVIDFAPIIPLKEDNAIVGDTHNLRMVLKKFNLEREDFIETLGNEKLDSAYLVVMIDPMNANTQAKKKAVFETLDLATSFGSVSTLKFSKLDMKVNANIHSIEINEKVLGYVDEYGSYESTVILIETIQNTETGELEEVEVETPVLVYWKQINSTQVKEIFILSTSVDFVISGYRMVASGFGTSDYVLGLSKNPEDFRLPIPLDVLNELDYKEWVDVYEDSLNLLAFSVETVSYEWYQSGPFRAIVQIVGIVLTVFAIATGQITWAQFVIRALIAIAVMYVIQQVAIAIGGELGMLFAFVAAVIATYYLPGFNTSSWTSWLQAANSGLNTMNQVVQHEMDKIIAQGEAYMAEMNAKMKDLEEKMEKYEDNGIMLHNGVIDSVGSPNRIFDTIEGYVSSIVNTEWLVDGDWMYNIDSQIAKRKSVYVGV